MDRRSFMQSSFLQAIGGASMLAASAGSAQAQGSERKTRLYRLSFFYMRQGDQVTRMNQFFSSQVPLLKKTVPRPVGMFYVFLFPPLPPIALFSLYPILAA